jgi:hypothetical protein
MATSSVKNLAIHLEKIAYGSAAVLGLLILLSPNLFTGSTNYNEIAEAKDKVKARISGKPFLPPPPPKIAEAVDRQWAVDGSDASVPWIPAWSVEARPAVIQVYRAGGDVSASHEAGTIAKIQAKREKLKLFLHVEGKTGKTDRCHFTAIKLLRQVGSGEWTELKTFKPAEAKGAIALDDADVKAGETYAYRLDTEVAPDAEGDGKTALLADSEKKKSSELLALGKQIPWDYSVNIITSREFDAKTNTPAELNGEVSWWDYDQGKVVKAVKPNWKEGDTFGTKVKSGERYKVLKIETNKVTIQDRGVLTLPQETLTIKENKRAVDLPPEVTPESVAAAAEAAKKAEEDAKAKAEAAAKDDEESGKKKATGKKRSGEGDEEDSKAKTPKKPSTPKKPTSKDKTKTGTTSKDKDAKKPKTR